MSKITDDAWWEWRGDAIELIEGYFGESCTYRHLSTKALRDIVGVIYEQLIQDGYYNAEKWETAGTNLDHCLAWEVEMGDPRKRNINYSRFPSWYFETP